MSSNRRDENSVPNIAGVSSITFTGNVEPAVNPVTHAWITDASTFEALISSYQVNNLDDSSTSTDVLFIGMARDDGTWAVKKFDESTSALPVVTYATITNNGSTTTYSTAWTNRATLTYDRYETAF